MRTWLHPQAVLWDMPVGNPVFFFLYAYHNSTNHPKRKEWTITGNPVAVRYSTPGRKLWQGLCLSILQMTLSVTIYFPAHCVSHRAGVTSTSTQALWPCGVLWPCTFCSDRSRLVFTFIRGTNLSTRSVLYDWSRPHTQTPAMKELHSYTIGSSSSMLQFLGWNSLEERRGHYSHGLVVIPTPYLHTILMVIALNSCQFLGTIY